MNGLIPEIEKISAYAKQERITKADIDAVAAPVLEAQVFDLTRAVAKGSYNQAAELLGVSPRECVFFDDSLSACKGAKAAGMTVVGVRDSCFHGAEADMRELCDRYIADFGELL